MASKKLTTLIISVAMVMAPQLGRSSFLDKLQKALDDAQASENQNNAVEGQNNGKNYGAQKAGSRYLTSIVFDPSNLNAENKKLLSAGLWRDPLTHLLWLRCPIGETWDGSSCNGKPTQMDWLQAIKIAQSANVGGVSGWRVPTIYEYKTLVRCGIPIDPAQAEQEHADLSKLPDNPPGSDGCYQSVESNDFRGAFFQKRVKGSRWLPLGASFKPSGTGKMQCGYDSYDQWMTEPAFFYEKVLHYTAGRPESTYWASDTKDKGIREAITFSLVYGASNVKVQDVEFLDSNFFQLRDYGINTYGPGANVVLVRDGDDKGVFMSSVQIAKEDEAKVNAIVERKKAEYAQSAQAEAEYKIKEEARQKREIEGLQQEKQDYIQLTQQMRLHPKVNDIAQQGRILEIRGDQVRVEVYHEVCVKYYSTGCGASEYVPNGAQSWINKNELLPARWIFYSQRHH